MASRTRRARVVLAVIALAVIGLGVWAWEPVYWAVMTKREYHESVWLKGTDSEFRARGWVSVQRWTALVGYGPMVFYYVDSGMVYIRVWSSGDGLRETVWSPDGTVAEQAQESAHGDVVSRNFPPWLWGVTDQTSPSIPAWMKDDAKWQAALDAQE